MTVQTTQQVMDGMRGIILAWLSSVVNYTVVFEQSSDPRPPAPYVAFKMLTGLIKYGNQDEVGNDPADVSGRSFLVKGHRKCTIRIEAIGLATDDLTTSVRATDILQDVQNSLSRPSIRDAFRFGNFSIIDFKAVTDISKLLETETEPRAQLEVVIGLAMEIQDAITTIEHVSVGGTFTKPNTDQIVIPPTVVP